MQYCIENSLMLTLCRSFTIDKLLSEKCNYVGQEFLALRLECEELPISTERIDFFSLLNLDIGEAFLQQN